MERGKGMRQHDVPVIQEKLSVTSMRSAVEVVGGDARCVAPGLGRALFLMPGIWATIQ